MSRSIRYRRRSRSKSFLQGDFSKNCSAGVSLPVRQAGLRGLVLAGTQQAFATSEPFFAHQAGVETRVLLVNDAGYSPYRTVYTTSPFLQQHPEIVAKFVRASLRGWKDYLNDPTAAHAVMAKLNPALNPEWMQFTWQQLRGGHFVAGDDPSGALSPVETLAQSVSTISSTATPVVTIPLVCALAGNGTWLA